MKEVLLTYLIFAQFQYTFMPDRQVAYLLEETSFILRNLLIVLSVFCVGKACISKKIGIFERSYAWLFMAFMLISFFNSMFRGNSFIPIIKELLPYMLAVTVFYLVMYSKVSMDLLEKGLALVAFTGGILSVLIGTNVLVTDQFGVQNQIIRSAYFIDGSVGVTGCIVATFVLLSERATKPKIYSVLMLLGSILILAYGMSRARIAITIILIGLLFLIAFLKNWKQKARGIFVLGLLCLLFGIAAYIFPDYIDSVTSRLGSRFEVLGYDDNQIFRNIERNMQLEEFSEAVTLGKGWGIRTQYVIFGDQMYNHCMYTTMLMHVGVLLTIVYFSFFILLLLINLVSARNLKAIGIEHLNILILLAAFMLGYGSAGIAKEGMLFGLAIVYTNMFEKNTTLGNMINTRRPKLVFKQ